MKKHKRNQGILIYNSYLPQVNSQIKRKKLKYFLGFNNLVSELQDNLANLHCRYIEIEI